MEEYHIKDTYLSDQQVLNKIWLEPKKVFRFLNDYQQDKYLVLLLLLFGIQQALVKVESSFNNSQNPFSIILVSVILGAMFGWIGQYIYAFFIHITGGLLGGKADTKSVLRVLAYSSIPIVFSLVFFVARYVMLGEDIFLSDVSHLGTTAVALNALFTILQGLLAVWSLILCVAGLSEIQKFSILRALANLILPALIPFLIVVGLLLLFKILT